MTQAEHLERARQHRQAAIEAIRTFQETRKQADWLKFKEEDKLANKHYGIAKAMFTRKYGKI